MRKKIIGIFVCMLMIGTIILPVTGKTSESAWIYQNKNDYLSNHILINNDSFLNDGINDFIINEMYVNHIPGLSASIVRNGRILWTESYGYANISQNLPVKDTTLFMLASISKTITGTALMQLYEQGYFKLDDPINEYLPFQVHNPMFPLKKITFRMLLTHSSSIRDNWDIILPYLPGDPKIPLGEYMEEYLTPRGEYYHRFLNFYLQRPGTDYHYSNIAVALAGYLVEVISGMPFDEYCKINIFKPLDMDETAWFLADLNSSHIAVPYKWNGQKFIPYEHYGYPDYPDGQLRTSATQLSHFLLMMMNHGEYNSTHILRESTIDLMLTPQLPFYMGQENGYWANTQGIIWYQIDLPGRTLWGHEGGDPGVSTCMFFEPETNIGVIILTNGENYDPLILSALFTFIETTNTPTPPTIHGFTDGKVEQQYSYTVDTTDPNGDDVYYFIDWGDNTNSSWIGPYPSGEVITESHTWSEKGKYTIQAKVKDVNEWESDWATLKVTVSKNKAIGNSNLKFMIAGKSLRALRSYWLHVPPSYDGSKPVPLVLNLCSLDQFSFKYSNIKYNAMEDLTNFSEKADEEGFIVVYPNQHVWLTTGFGPYYYTGKLLPIYLVHGWDYGYYPYWAFKFIDDIGFMQDLIDKMKQDYNINSSRIYVTGFSDGAFMSYSIGAYLSDTVAAIAPVCGSIGSRSGTQESMYYTPTPKNPVSVIAFHGTADEELYNGTNAPTVNESISFWVEHNGCDPTPEIYTSESGKIIRRTYTNGENGTEVVLYEIVGGEHVWPGNPYDDTIHEISATDLIWEFFATHPKQ